MPAPHSVVIPAQAGIQHSRDGAALPDNVILWLLHPRLRGDDTEGEAPVPGNDDGQFRENWLHPSL